MRDTLSKEAARLAAEQQGIREDRSIPRHEKQERIAALQEKISAIIEVRRKQNAQRVNRVGPAEQANRGRS